MKYKLSFKEKLKSFGMVTAMTIGTLFVINECNNTLNDRNFKSHGYETHSFTNNIAGHVDYTRYSDGSSDVRIYSSGAGMFDSEFHQDINGDGKVDRIRQEGSGLKMNRLVELLVREDDYESNKKEFDEADARLKGLKERFDK